MIISLVGYMGVGKSHISRILSKKLNFKLIDLDQEIFFNEGQPIKTIFENKGELYFRKRERETLKSILERDENIILSLGGGTPAYYDNMEIINKYSISIFLQASVSQLSNRLLKNKNKRPLIAHLSNEDLPEFIAKHLFERNNFYTKSKFIINTNNKKPENIVNEIISLVSSPINL